MKNLRVKSVAYHRNGVAGVGFYAVCFTGLFEGVCRTMIATAFCNAGDPLESGEPHPCNGRVTVLDATLAARGIIDETNRWRGDVFEPHIRQWIAQYEYAREQADNTAPAVVNTAP